MRRWFIVIVAACLTACGSSSTPSGSTAPGVMVNGASKTTVAFSGVGYGATQAVTATQTNAGSGTLFIATLGSGCSGVASIAGSSTATTSNGPSGAFTVTALSVQPAGTCTISVSSSAGGAAGTVSVDTSGVPTVSPTGIGIH
ncbi:MAG: hypothetical protein ACRENA_01220 [Vulcanimicrobiaceae bacterium]